MRHEHRFPYAVAGDTRLVCYDCRQVVYITPEQAATAAGELIPEPMGIQLPDLLESLSGNLPQYAQIAIRYNYWMFGKHGW